MRQRHECGTMMTLRMMTNLIIETKGLVQFNHYIPNRQTHTLSNMHTHTYTLTHTHTHTLTFTHKHMYTQIYSSIHTYLPYYTYLIKT